MKKSLLILCVGLSGLVCAQNAPNQTKVSRAKMLLPTYDSPKAENGAKQVTSNKTNSLARHTQKTHSAMAATKVYVGSAHNMFGVLTAECTQVDANQALGMISFTHRESAALPYGSGAYETDFSLDGGNTWDTAKGPDSVIFRTSNAAANGTRYPNGVILNPSSNGANAAANAYAVSTGPHTDGTTWDSVGYGSIQLNGTNPNEQEGLMYPNTVNTTDFVAFTAPHFMQTTNDSIIHSVAEAWSYNSGLTATQGFYGAVVNKGVWNGATHKVTWTDTVIRPHLASYAGIAAPVDSEAELTAVSMAWSQDGSVGYLVFFGNLDSAGYNYASLQPIVYKTINHGSTWAMMPLYNFGNISGLVQHLTPTLDSGTKLPFWDINGDSAFYTGHDVDMTVDANNNLHIFGVIESGAIANPDSGGYSYNPSINPARYIYDVYTTSAIGGWKAYLLDSLISPEGVDVNNTLWTSSANGALTWGARLQASRTADGKKVFCTWLDDYNADGEIIQPDITTIGIDVNSGLRTSPLRVTNDGINYFLQVSDIALPNSTCYNIPCVVAFDPNPTDGTTPVEFMYVQGATLCNTDFNTTAVQEIAGSNSGFSVGPNYPNPFNGITQFNIALPNESLVSVDVFNLFGQKVYSIPAKQMSTGNHLMAINGKGWSSGVYFYRVTVGDKSITQKMVIQ